MIFHHRRRQRGFTLVETAVAMAVTVISLVGFYASEQQAFRIVRAGRSVASVSEMLQERIEAFRYAPPWSNVTTAAGVASVTASAPAVAATFTYASETFTVQDYPSGSQLVVTRTAGGTFTNNGVDVSSSRCVKLTVSATWIAPGNLTKTRQISTILAKGGI